MQDNNLFYSYTDLHLKIQDVFPGKRIGFVPTMGALHEGHLSLIELALHHTELVVVNIFVNPTQFNNANDLEKYPRTLDLDVALIRNKYPDVLIVAPDYEAVYPENVIFPSIDLKGLDDVMEGEFRPGHFKGVCHVVYNLFQLVKPSIAFFGAKDFQQVAIIKYMVKALNINVEIRVGETIRDINGLALSSRNQRLTDAEKQEALIIYKTLRYIKDNYTQYSPEELLVKASEFFDQATLRLEYLQLVNSENLQTITDWNQPTHCCIAAYCGDVRLIDNLQIK